jgi:hypothetical protein
MARCRKARHLGFQLVSPWIMSTAFAIAINPLFCKDHRRLAAGKLPGPPLQRTAIHKGDAFFVIRRTDLRKLRPTDVQLASVQQAIGNMADCCIAASFLPRSADCS